MAREKKPVHKVVMTEGKRNIIQQLLGSVKDFSQIGLQTLLYRSQPAMEASSMAASRCFIFM